MSKAKRSDRPGALYGPRTTPLSLQTSRPWIVEDAQYRMVKRFTTEEKAHKWLKENSFDRTGEVAE